MSAETLREAARLMRERAEKAERGRWKLWGMTVLADPLGTSDVDDGIEVARVFTPSWCEPRLRTWNAKHIASWHPAVALAVADLLDDGADFLDHVAANYPDAVGDEGEFYLAAARAYLGTDVSADSPRTHRAGVLGEPGAPAR